MCARERARQYLSIPVRPSACVRAVWAMFVFSRANIEKKLAMKSDCRGRGTEGRVGRRKEERKATSDYQATEHRSA